ncbi:MAG: TolC family protein [Candidatus Firestonebacteria bacterium]
MLYYIKIVFIAIFMHCSSFFLYSIFAEENIFTIENAIDYAMRNNLGILSAQNTILSAKTSIKEAESSKLPKIDTSLSYAHLTEPSAIGLLEKPETYTSKMSIYQPLYTWNRLTLSVNFADLNSQVKEIQYAIKKVQLIYDTKAAFYDILLARYSLAISEDALTRMDEHLRKTNILFKNGELSQYDVLQAEIQVYNAKALILKNKNILEKNYENFNRIIGRNISLPVEINGEFSLDYFSPNVNDAIKNAILNRPEISSVILEKKLVDINYELSLLKYSPTFSLSNDMSIIERANKFPPDDKLVFNWQIGLALNIPIYYGGIDKIAKEQSEFAIEEIKLKHKNIELEIEAEIRNTHRVLTESKEIIKLREKNVEIAKEGLRQAQIRYENNLIPSFEIITAQLTLTEAKSNYQQALYDYAIAKAKFIKVVGGEK